MHPNAYGVYKNNSVNFASKEQMLLMLLDGAVKFAKRGKLAIQEKDIKMAHNSITRTQDIFTELKVLRNKDNQTSIDRRFNVLITSATYQEFVYHLRMMFNLLRSRIKGDYYIDFGRLAQDLYWYHRGYPESIRLNWARSYYSFTQEKEKVDYET